MQMTGIPTSRTTPSGYLPRTVGQVVTCSAESKQTAAENYLLSSQKKP